MRPGCQVHLTSPVADPFWRNVLSSMSLPSLSTARGPTSSCLVTSIVCATARVNLCLSSSNSAADRASSPLCTWDEEQQPVKEKTVRVEELIRPSSRASLVDGPMVTGGRDCKELSWRGGESRGSWGMTSPRKRFSSQRKEEVCEEAGRDPLTYLRNSQRAGIFTWHHLLVGIWEWGQPYVSTAVAWEKQKWSTADVTSWFYTNKDVSQTLLCQKGEVWHLFCTERKKYFLLILCHTHVGGLCVSRNAPFLRNTSMSCQQYVPRLLWNTHRLEKTATKRNNISDNIEHNR